MSDLFIVAGVIIVAVVAYWQGRERGYRAGHRDGWNQFADKLQQDRYESAQRARPKPGKTIRVMLPNGDSYEKLAPEDRQC